MVADHIVRGRVIFPGAAYLETARAAYEAALSASSGATLGSVFFLRPLVLCGAGQEREHAWLECALRVDGGFEVRPAAHGGERHAAARRPLPPL